ncbi:hypothetical protein [Clostridium sp. 1001271B_151109_B4]|uniref:hypothetical protein n=1 Tax=Clostridium sp. 1001271B_151109_B4 TaxID=2787148 RepID=UPI0018ABE2A8|nr:hypothetical protein [Clostridium sp. 1001271B_151109_B4]
MIYLEHDDLEVIKKILGKLYLENGLTEEVILLSRVVDKAILNSYVELQFDDNVDRNKDNLNK